jgi:hypothetical protein
MKWMIPHRHIDFMAEIQIGETYVQKKTNETRNILMDIPESSETETKKFLGIKIKFWSPKDGRGRRRNRTGIG